MLMAGKEGNTCRQAFDFDSVGVRWAGVLGTGMRDGATTLLCPCDILVLVNGFQTSRCCVVEVGDNLQPRSREGNIYGVKRTVLSSP